MKNRVTAFVMSLLMLFSCCVFSGCEKEAEPAAFSVLYIPLDNRPINDLQVQLLAKSLNIELIMPDEGIYATTLNGAVNDAGLQYGDRNAVFEWLMSHESESDTMVIYLDQLLSGGLMNSRCMEDLEPVTLSDGRSFTEYEIIDYLAELAATHKLYLIDSQLRLATSSDYLDFSLRDYNITRAYGMLERPELSEDASIDDIVANYTLSPDGGSALDAGEFSAEDKEYFLGTEEKSPLERYLSIRERKLRLNAYAIEKLYSLDNVSYFFGVDDSASGNNIQSAEYAYLNALAGGNLEKLSAIDCLGELAVSTLFSDFCGNEPVSVAVRYFGSENSKLNFAGHTVCGAVEQMLAVCGGEICDDAPEVEILVACEGETEEETRQAAEALVEHFIENCEKHQPSIYVDFGAAVNQELPNSADITMFLSAGLHANGSGASAIMGISQGLARYRALKLDGYLTDSCHEAFLEDMLLMFAKGYYWKSVYKQEMSDYIAGQGLNENNLTGADSFKLCWIEKTLTEKINASSADIIASANGGSFIASLSPYSEMAVGKVSIENCSYPWLRTFEFSAELNAELE